MITTIILIILLLLIIELELLATRSGNRLSLWLGIISLLLWLVAVFKLASVGRLL